MGLYNMIMGRNPYAPYLLALIDIHEGTKDIYPLGRMRDVHINVSADRIFLFTRNYGEEWEYVDEALAKNPNYVEKRSESSDSTYTSYEFSVPEDNKACGVV